MIGRGRRAGQRFDGTYGVTTEALVFLGQLDPEAIGPSIEFATHYEATPVADFDDLIGAVPMPLEQATFVDLGCGMGRTLLLASRRPFKQIVGIEISPALCQIAKENLAAFDRALQRCRDLRVVRADARDAELPGGALVAYLYNPFRGEVMRSVAERLAERDGATVVVYHTPLEREAFEDSKRFEIVAELPCGIVYRRSEEANDR